VRGDMTPIKITDEMKANARRGDARIMATFKKKDGNYTGLSETDRFYNGILGELALVELLKQKGIRAKYTPNWNGFKDKGDATVWCEDYPLIVDVKTCTKDFHTNLFMPEKQYQKYSHDGYIGVRIVGDVAEIHGYCAKKDFTRSQNPNVKVATYGIELTALRPIERLFEKLDKGEITIVLP
jgi:hypothetical protein